MTNNEEEIFYSDEDISDSELYQVCSLQLGFHTVDINHPSQGSQGSRYFAGNKPESIFSSRLWQNAGGISPENVSNTMYNTIDR